MTGAAQPSARDRSTARRLAPPQQQVPLCKRELVLRSLDVARRTRLTLVLGPPGYGKTTALAQWHARLRNAGHAVAWYSATEAEREPSQFLRLLILALEAGGIDPGPVARRAAVGGSVEAMLDSIVLGLEQLDEPLVFIIDDYDRIDQAAVAQYVTELLSALPTQVTLVLGTRRKPSLALAMLRATGGLRTIDPDELKFGADELAATTGLPLDSPEFAMVLAQTEGWPVAVQLYRLWRERVANGAVLPTFGGHASEIADYLAEQVVAALPGEQQAALIALSIVEQVEASLADAIREAHDSAALLDTIAQALPSLVQQTASEGEIAYRVHPLLSDYARSRLALEPDRAAMLHQRAARWLAHQARHVDSVRHAVLGRDEAFLRDLLDRLPFRSVFVAYGVGELRAILREVPPGAVASLPKMRLMQALMLFKEGFFREAEQLRREVEAAFDPEGAETGTLLVESRALRLLFSSYMEGPGASDEAQIAWLLDHAPADPLMWAWCENCRMVSEQERGLLDRARLSLDRARQAFEAKQESSFGLLQLIAHDMLIELARGALRNVHEQAGALLRRSPTSLIGERCVHAMARMAMAEVDYQRSYRPQAAEEMRIALAEYGRGEAWFDQYAIAMPVIVDVTFRRHGLGEAQRELEAAARDYGQRGMICLEGMLAGVELACRVRAGGLSDIKPLETACRQKLTAAGAEKAPWRERDLLLRALTGLALARSDASEAKVFARLLFSEGQSGGRLGAQVQGLLLLTRAHRLASEEDDAMTHLREAVLRASAEGLVAPFAETGREIAPLLRRLLTDEPSRVVQRHLVGISRAIDAEQHLADPDALSDREAEIVAHLADGASNKLIARRLGLTENTIKFHLKKVYGKLGVKTRKQAVARVLQQR